MPLQVAKRAVIGQDVEPVGGALEGATGLVAAIASGSGVGPKERGALVDWQPADECQQLAVGQIGDGIQRRGDDFQLAIGIEISQSDMGRRLIAVDASH